MADTPNRERIFAAIVDAARDPLENGRADLSTRAPGPAGGWPAAELTPRNAAACPIIVPLGVDEGPGVQLHTALGRYETPYEVYGRDLDELLGELRELVETIIAGGYEETVRLSRGRLAAAKATINFKEGPHHYTYGEWPPRRKRGPWTPISYEPY